MKYLNRPLYERHQDAIFEKAFCEYVRESVFKQKFGYYVKLISDMTILKQLYLEHELQPVTV